MYSRISIDYSTMESIISIKKYAPTRSEMDEKNILCFNMIVKDTRMRKPSKSIPIVGSKSNPISNTDTILLASNMNSYWLNGGGGGGGDGCECDGCEGGDCC